MLAIYPFHAEDQELALKNALWIAELGTVEKHQALVIHDKHADPEIGKEIEAAFMTCFRHATRAPLREAAPGVRGMNLLFRRALRQVQHCNAGSFLWMNPDAIPIREGWLDAIEAATLMLPRGKYFLGALIDSGSFPYMSAVAVYPEEAELQAPNIVLADQNAFNFNAAPQIVPKMAATQLIGDTQTTLFGEEWAPGVSAPLLPSTAVLWHGSPDCKSGDVIDRLRRLPPDRIAPLEILPVNKTSNGSQPKQPEHFRVPTSNITHDAAAEKAASRAGSEGLPADEIDTSTHVPKVAVPQVTPVKAVPAREHVLPTPTNLRELAETVQYLPVPCIEVTPENMGAVLAALARFRDKDPASKAATLAALRAHGFQIMGKQKGAGVVKK